MLKNTLCSIIAIASVFIAGCASVPMSSAEEDAAKKQFTAPSSGKSGLYIYRNSIFGAALKKTILIDGGVIGETAKKTYFFREVHPGKHELATESEFSDNILIVDFKAGVNYFVRQYIRLGAFVGGANLELVSEEVGKKGVLECKLAKEVKITSEVSN